MENEANTPAPKRRRVPEVPADATEAPRRKQRVRNKDGTITEFEVFSCREQVALEKAARQQQKPQK